MSNTVGSSNTFSSRLADASQKSSLSPGSISSPRRLVEHVAVRRLAGDGVAQRRISSSARGSRERSARRSSSRSRTLDEREQAAGDGVARGVRAGGESKEKKE